MQINSYFDHQGHLDIRWWSRMDGLQVHEATRRSYLSWDPYEDMPHWNGSIPHAGGYVSESDTFYAWQNDQYDAKFETVCKIVGHQMTDDPQLPGVKWAQQCAYCGRCNEPECCEL